MNNSILKNTKTKNTLWFSIIEVLVAIFIFSLWLVSVYAVISSTFRLNEYNKNHIIASNLAREQIELLKNIRDVNFKTVHKYNERNPNWNSTNDTLYYRDPDNFFSIWSYYLIDNDYSSSAIFPIKVSEITNFWEWKGEVSWWGFWKMQSYRLCLDSENKYLSVDSNWNCPVLSEETKFFKYLKIDELKYNSWWIDYDIPNSFKVKSKVIWYIRWYHETEINTIITDWQRL